MQPRGSAQLGWGKLPASRGRAFLEPQSIGSTCCDANISSKVTTTSQPQLVGWPWLCALQKWGYQRTHKPWTWSNCGHFGLHDLCLTHLQKSSLDGPQRTLLDATQRRLKELAGPGTIHATGDFIWFYLSYLIIVFVGWKRKNTLAETKSLNSLKPIFALLLDAWSVTHMMPRLCAWTCSLTCVKSRSMCFFVLKPCLFWGGSGHLAARASASSGHMNLDWWQSLWVLLIHFWP